MTDNQRKIVIPGEVIVSGDDYLPGEWTEKKGSDIVANRYGLVEESNRLVKLIPLSGSYAARRGNVVIGEIEMLTFNGWVINIGPGPSAFLPISEYPKYVNKDGLDDIMSIGDTCVAKIISINKKGVDLTMKSRGLGKIEGGIIMKINPNKVPRVIGKEGSMIKLINDESGCNITVGQNGLIWIRGESVEDELFAKKAINFVTERSFVEGLTDKLKEWFDKNGGKK
jgi:exosome complex component RRP4